jgi:hypothetical protein
MNTRILAIPFITLTLAVAPAAVAQTGYGAVDTVNEKIGHQVAKSLLIENLSSSTWTFGVEFAAKDPGKIQVSYYDPGKDQLTASTTITDQGEVRLDPAVGNLPSVVVLTPAPERPWNYYPVKWIKKEDNRPPFLRACYLDDQTGHPYGRVKFFLQRHVEKDKTPFVDIDQGEQTRVKGAVEFVGNAQVPLTIVIKPNKKGAAVLPPPVRTAQPAAPVEIEIP